VHLDDRPPWAPALLARERAEHLGLIEGDGHPRVLTMTFAVAGCDCVPPYPETRAYFARILGLLDGTGELEAPLLEVRLTE
jgi:hypothetical protein